MAFERHRRATSITICFRVNFLVGHPFYPRQKGIALLWTVDFQRLTLVDRRRPVSNQCSPHSFWTTYTNSNSNLRHPLVILSLHLAPLFLPTKTATIFNRGLLVDPDFSTTSGVLIIDYPSSSLDPNQRCSTTVLTSPRSAKWFSLDTTCLTIVRPTAFSAVSNPSSSRWWPLFLRQKTCLLIKIPYLHLHPISKRTWT